jgi:hypothetical protein
MGHYGEAAALTLTRDAGRRTVAEIRLPFFAKAAEGGRRDDVAKDESNAEAATGRPR